jgi:putative endonuclease
MLNRGKLLSDRKLLGRWGEKRCEKFLKRKGLKLLVRNFSCKSGEVDLIMVDAKGGIVFIEVKTRGDEAFAPAESALTEAKKKRLYRAARFFLSAHHIEDRFCRFDLVTVVAGRDGHEKITHYENAFAP